MGLGGSQWSYKVKYYDEKVDRRPVFTTEAQAMFLYLVRKECM